MSTFQLYNTIVFWNYNWYVSIWIIKFVFPLTTRISVFSSSPVRNSPSGNAEKETMGGRQHQKYKDVK